MHNVTLKSFILSGKKSKPDFYIEENKTRQFIELPGFMN